MQHPHPAREPRAPLAPTSLDLHVLDHAGGEPTLLLLHGLTANAHSLDGVAAALAPRVRVVAPDLRGRGRSPKPAHGYRMADHAADLLALLDALGIERATLGGHSFGGLLALWIAAHHPERVERLILLDSAASIHPRTRELIQPSLDRLGQRLPSLESYLAAMRAAPIWGGQWDEQIERYYRADVETLADGTVQPRSHPDHIAEAADGALAEPWGALAERVRCPVLIVHATQPLTPGSVPVTTAAQVEEARAIMPQAHYVPIEATHYTLLFGAAAREVAGAIEQFLIPPPDYPSSGATP